MLEAGVHFGHQTRRWNPKMKKYIFGSRNGIHIIDLQKSVKMFKECAETLTEYAAEGKQFLFVGTKRQAQDLVEQESDRSDSYYVNHRWLGGMMTNFETIKNSINRMKQIRETLDSPDATMTKKERIKMEREYEKLYRVLRGIKDMKKLPDALVVMDINKEHIAVKEAIQLDIPVFAIVDTNCDPDPIEHIIPGNDDAIRAIQLFLNKFSDCILEGREIYKKRQEEAKKAEEQAKMEAEKAKPAEEKEEKKKPAKKKAAPEKEDKPAKDEKKEAVEEKKETKKEAKKEDKPEPEAEKKKETKKVEKKAEKKAEPEKEAKEEKEVKAEKEEKKDEEKPEEKTAEDKDKDEAEKAE